MKKFFLILLLIICSAAIVQQGFRFVQKEIQAVITIALLSHTEPLAKEFANRAEAANTQKFQPVKDVLSQSTLVEARLYNTHEPELHQRLYLASATSDNRQLDRQRYDRAWFGFSDVQLIMPGPSETGYFGQVYLPVVRNGNTASVLVLTYNITQLWQRLETHYNQNLFVILLCLALFFTIMALFAIRRHRLEQAAEIHANFLVHNDVLTGLPNRASFMKALDVALNITKRNHKTFSLSIINIDKFKDFNTTYGRRTADEMIRLASERISRILNRNDKFFRIGGGEFAVLSDQDSAQDSLRHFGETVIGTVRSISRVNGRDVNCSASIAVAIAPTDGQTSEALMAATQLAMERAHNEGRGAFCFFEASMDMASRAQKQLEEDLRIAIIRQEFEARYQPQFNSLSGELVGFESLIRWQHPERGLVSPDSFIPIAEETRLIVDMGYWILQRACLDALSWPKPVKVAVNLSPIQFEHDNVALVIAKALDKTGLPPQRLEVEITESILVDKQQKVSDALSALSAMGVRIAMDDFGTGYSSLATLVKFDFHKLKIDRSFITMMEDQKGSEAIVDFVIRLGQALGVDILAEGVETWDQVETLRQMGCFLIQGYYFGRPMTQSEVMKSFSDGSFIHDLPAFMPHNEVVEAYNPLKLKSFFK